MARKTSKPGKKKNSDKASNKKNKTSKAVGVHRSFKRSYREDYVRELDTPGIMSHIVMTFRALFKDWKLFLPLALIAVVIMVSTVEALNETGIVFAVLTFLFLWLTTIFIMRRRMAEKQVHLREAIYNALTPLASTLVVLIVAAIECLPIVIVVIAYSTAEETNFFAMPFYALLFLVFAALLIILSAYLLSSSLMALVAVSAPGVYPLTALEAAMKLMMGRRIKFVLRLIAVLFVFAIVWGAVVLPVVLIFNAPAVVTLIIIEILACFGSEYLATYLYLYYRWMLDYDTKEVK